MRSGLAFTSTDLRFYSKYRTLVIIVLFALIVAIFTLPLLNPLHSECSKCAQAQRETSSLTQALAQQNSLNWPIIDTKNEGQFTSTTQPRLPVDPWGNNYHFAQCLTSDHLCVFILSFGSDGKPGGKEISEKDIYGPPTDICIEIPPPK